jgi:hypothetical protein
MLEDSITVLKVRNRFANTVINETSTAFVGGSDVTKIIFWQNYQLTTQGIRLVTESINTKLPELFTT